MNSFVGYYLTILAPKVSTPPPEICHARCVEWEPSKQIEVRRNAQIAPLAASLLVLHKRSAKLVLWDISQRRQEQLFALLAAQATVQISLVKRNAPSALLENSLLEQQRQYAKTAMRDLTLRKGRLNVFSVSQVPMQIFLRPLAPCAQLESTNSSWE